MVLGVGPAAGSSPDPGRGFTWTTPTRLVMSDSREAQGCLLPASRGATGEIAALGGSAAAEQRPPAPGPPHTRTPLLSQFEIRQLRAHLAQQGLDLAAEREAALLAPHVLGRPLRRYHVREVTAAPGGVEVLQPPAGKRRRGLAPPRQPVPLGDCAPVWPTI